METQKERCIYKDCTKEARARGLCMPHYAFLGRKVKSGEVSWQFLEARRYARPPQAHLERMIRSEAYQKLLGQK